MYCYPGTVIGLYNPSETEKANCEKGIPCYFGICSECTQTATKEELNEAKTDNGTNGNNND